MRRTGLAGFAFAAVAVVGLAGCGSNGGSNTASGGGSGAGTVEVSSTPLGSVLTDGAGKTLYLFTKDAHGKSACEGQCIATWPFLAGDPAAGKGADATLIGTIKRSDGSTQATYAGRPLYYYGGDGNAGDVKGQGIEGTWFVIDAKGDPVGQAPPTTSTGGGGY